MQTTPTPSRGRTLRHAAYGVLATVVGLAAAHLVAAFTVPAASPVLAVGSTVIDLTPTPLKEWAIREFGSADKIILVGSVTVVVLLLAAAAGIIAAKRETVGLLIVVGLAGVAGVLAVLRPGAGPLDLIPALVAAVIASTSLWWLHRIDDQGAAGSSAQADGPSRRGVVLATGGLAAAAVTMGALGRYVTSYRLGGTDIALPVATDPAAAFPQGLEEMYDGITPLQTPNADFYRVDTRLTVPAVDVDSWTLTIDGDVDQEVTLTFDDLAAMGAVERDITLTCVSNEVGGPYVGAARWLGVPAGRRARPGRHRLHQGRPDPLHRRRRDDHLDTAGRRPRRPRLADRDRDERQPLPRENGFPVRMVVPGLYGFVSACKWITRMTLTTYDAEQAYWTERDWAIDAPIKLSSRIDTPRALSKTPAGQVIVGGVAWAQGSGIEKVDVRIDGEAWKPAELGPEVNNDYWRQWFYKWDASAGSALPRRSRHQQGRRRPDRRADGVVPRGVVRDPGDLPHDRVTPHQPHQLPAGRCVAQVPSLPDPAPLTARRSFRINSTFSSRSPIRPPHRTEHLLKAGHHGPHQMASNERQRPMNTKLRTRTLGLAALALTASMSLAACGSESDTDTAAEPTTSETPMESETPAEDRRGGRPPLLTARSVPAAPAFPPRVKAPSRAWSTTRSPPPRRTTRSSRRWSPP